MAYCLYCGKEKTNEELTQEHFLPRAVGGNLDTYNPFSINNVCERCNTLSGLFIDAPFIKGWFLYNDRAANAKKYADIKDTTVLPLTYMGVLDNLKFQNRLCEFWLGPTGDSIYHFHEPWPSANDIPTMAGWPIGKIRKSIDKGFVFAFIRSNNPKWHPAIVNSIASHFKDATIYPGNFNVVSPSGFKAIPSELNALYEEIKGLSGKTHNGKISVPIDYGVRFLCKLALAFGYIILGNNFVLSHGADILRQGMWAKNVAERESVDLHGSPFFNPGNGLNELNEMMNWKGGHSFILMPFEDGLGLYANFYEGRSAVIQIKYPIHNLKEGVAFVVAPTLQKCVGPIKMSAFMAHRNVAKYVQPELKQLDDMINAFNGWPAYDV